MTLRKPAVTRRTALATTAGLLTAGGLAITFSTERASAGIVMSQFDVPDAGFVSDDGQPSGIHVFADAAWEYDVGQATPATRVIALYARDDNGGFHPLDVPERATSAPADSGTTALAGDLLATDAFAPGDFAAPGDGQSRTVNVLMGVLLNVLDANGSSLVKARATREVGIMVTEEGVSSAIGADGQVAFKDDAGDPTPTRPP